MGSSTKPVTWWEMQVGRLLAGRPAVPSILVGTLALAGISSAVLNATPSHPTPGPSVQAPGLQLGAPHTFCRSDFDGAGHTICHIPAGQVTTVPNLGCSADPDGDGTYICYYATDPRTSN